MNAIKLHLDKSTSAGLHFEAAGGTRVYDLETVFREGFTVRPDDVPAVLTLIARFVEGRDLQRM